MQTRTRRHKVMVSRELLFAAETDNLLQAVQLIYDLSQEALYTFPEDVLLLPRAYEKDLDVLGDNGNSALHLAVLSKASPLMLQLLLISGIDYELKNDLQETAIDSSDGFFSEEALIIMRHHEAMTHRIGSAEDILKADDLRLKQILNKIKKQFAPPQPLFFGPKQHIQTRSATPLEKQQKYEYCHANNQRPSSAGAVFIGSPLKSGESVRTTPHLSPRFASFSPIRPVFEDGDYSSQTESPPSSPPSLSPISFYKA